MSSASPTRSAREAAVIGSALSIWIHPLAYPNSAAGAFENSTSTGIPASMVPIIDAGSSVKILLGVV